VAAAALLGGCSDPHRNFGHADLGGSTDRGASASTETQTGMLQATPTLEVQPPVVDLGAVTTGFAARARVKISNSGVAALPTPEVT